LSCLYYTREPAIALAEAARVLKPGGVLVMTAPTRLSLFGIHRRLVRRLGMSGWDHLAGAQFIDVSTWRRMAHAAGFATTHVDGFVVSFVLRLLWRRLQSALGQLGIALREWRDREGRSSLAREIRAHIAYHAILVLEKRDSSSA
jgi:SAM-dependent methyltransferase